MKDEDLGMQVSLDHSTKNKCQFLKAAFRDAVISKNESFTMKLVIHHKIIHYVLEHINALWHMDYEGTQFYTTDPTVGN